MPIQSAQNQIKKLSDFFLFAHSLAAIETYGSILSILHSTVEHEINGTQLPIHSVILHMLFDSIFIGLSK